MKRASSRNPLLRTIFLIYCGLMLWLLFYKNRSSDTALAYWEQIRLNINLQPLHTIRNYLYVIFHGTSASLVRHCYVNLLGNILLFIPFGVMLPRIFPKFARFGRFFLCCLLTILAVELGQLFTLLGSFDVDDVVLNLLGMCIGFLFAKKK